MNSIDNNKLNTISEEKSIDNFKKKEKMNNNKKGKKRPFKYNLNITNIRNEKKENLNKKTLLINDQNLNDNQKRLLLLKTDKSTSLKIDNNNNGDCMDNYGKELSYTNNRSEIWMNKNTEKKNEIKLIQNKKSSEKDKGKSTTKNRNMIFVINNGEIRKKKLEGIENQIQLLKKNKSTEIIILTSQEESPPSSSDLNRSYSLIPIAHMNIDMSSSSYNEQSTRDNTGSNYSITNNNNSYNKKIKYNATRCTFYIKHKLYDHSVSQEYVNNKAIIVPEKREIDEQHFGYLYPNDFKTYYFTSSQAILKEIKYDDLDNEDKNFDKSVGLYFCGKETEMKLENKIVTKKCKPNEFICKDCMKLNKEKYNIKDNYFININGRVSKIINGHYHCCGHFLCQYQIADCINKFTCEACKTLELYLKYNP